MKVFPGEFYVTAETDEVLVTVLGSCVSACIRDPIAGIGGMNHFMLPQDKSGAWGDDLKSTRFGNFAMEKLINELHQGRMRARANGNQGFRRRQCHRHQQRRRQRQCRIYFALSQGRRVAVRCAAISAARCLDVFTIIPPTGRVVRRLLGGSERYSIDREEHDYGNRLRSSSLQAK